MEIPYEIKFPFEAEFENVEPFSKEYTDNEDFHRKNIAEINPVECSGKDNVELVTWMCVGVPKGGTTSLYELLKKHPKIYIPKSKETHFFSSTEYFKGMSYYSKRFFDGVDNRNYEAVGEITPKYLLHSKLVPFRLKKHLSDDLKFIVLLRDPVFRAWSHYCHSFERFKLFSFRPTEDLSFRHALSVERKRLCADYEDTCFHHSWNAYYYTGLYDIHLKNWFEVFDRSRFLIIKLEELIRDPEKITNSITDFLSIEPFHSFPDFPKTNSYSQIDFPEDIKQELSDFYRPHVSNLENLLDRDFSDWLR